MKKIIFIVILLMVSTLCFAQIRGTSIIGGNTVIGGNNIIERADRVTYIGKFSTEEAFRTFCHKVSLENRLKEYQSWRDLFGRAMDCIIDYQIMMNKNVWRQNEAYAVDYRDVNGTIIYIYKALDPDPNVYNSRALFIPFVVKLTNFN